MVLAPGQIGLYQADLVLPAGLAPADYPVVQPQRPLRAEGYRIFPSIW